ncbi:MAG: Ig-like domain-containing protein [Bacteroidales bacterium]|nr:Ig-like domain-containing protein [Bacteroidales bacterium]
MKKYVIKLVTLLVSVVLCNGAFAQINSGKGAVPFGSNTQYNYGIMPTNLPTGGTYGRSQKAADAYNAWKNAYVASCGSTYRVKFDDGNSTVSEGIAYGMLLSVYADDKGLFDGLWGYYQANKNGNGVMNWKIGGCSGVTGSNGATDAELDVAMALVIASEQWGGSYAATAKSFIQTIKRTEMNGDGQTLNGDAWGNTNSCRNPSYFAPAYYKEFANVDTDNGKFWGETAINASNSVLSANRNSTSGLVSNWCDNSGQENTCGNTGSGAGGYGADACRNPWRMAVDYLWHGDGASSAAKDINAKLTKFVNGYENQMKGPFSNRNCSNPGGGSYVNGSYSTFALPPMTSSSAQSSLNKCYAAVAGLADVDAYFNSTIRCISLFVLTGNFWAPGASGFVFPPSVSSAETDASGLTITLNMTKTMKSGTSSGSNFTVYYNGTAQSGVVSNVNVNSDKTVDLTLSTPPQPGQTILLSYNGNGNIKSSEDAELEAFTKIEVLNMLAGNETILDDCEDGNEFNNVGGIWFSFDDSPDQSKACKKGTTSSITPLSSRNNPLQMSSPGYDGTGYAVHATYKLCSNYTPYNGGSCAEWTNPAYVGIGTWVDDDETNTMDWTGGTGVTFWYKGPACTFQIIISEVTDYCFHKFDVPATPSWDKITVKWNQLSQPTWGKAVDFSAKHVQKLQWQFETGTTGNSGASGDIWIDEVHILGMPPVALTGLTIQPVDDDDLREDHYSPNIDPQKIPIASGVKGDTLYLETVPTPGIASYPVTFWSSSDEDVVTVDYRGRVLGVGYGEATITARSKMHQDISTTYTVKVPAPSIYPTAINFEEDAYEVGVGETATIIPTFTPSNTNETALTWKSSDVTKATVSSSGVVTGISEGTVEITATSVEKTNVKKTVTVTVKNNAVALESITPDKTSVKIPVGETSTINLTFSPDNATNKNVTWTTSDPNIATVADGVISSVAAGTCTITATSEENPEIKAEIAVEIENICVTSITLNETSMTLDVDSEEDYVVSVTDYTTNYDLTPSFKFSSSDTKVLRVDSGTGELTIRSVGTAIVTVTSEDACQNTATCEIIIEKSAVPVTGVSLDKTTLTLTEGDNASLVATVAPDDASDKSVSWESSAPAIATVDQTGKVSAVAAGSATITVKTTDGEKTATCEVTVNAAVVAVTGVTLDKTTASMLVGGDDLQLTATVAPDDATNKNVTWTSSNDKIATVDQTGKVTAVAAGTATITVTTEDGGKTATCVVTTTVPVASVTLDQTSATMVEGDQLDLVATITPDNATEQGVTWSSDKEDIAIVNGSGKVTAKAPGVAVITVTTVDGSKTATCQITVEKKIILPTSISMATSLGFVDGGEAQTLTATVLPADADDKSIEWTSSNDAVATVVDGVVTPQGVGNCVITAKCVADKNVTAECAVTVTASTVAVTGVSLDQATLEITEGEHASLKATVTPADATNQNLIWSSDADAIATVENGVVSAVKAGSAVITVKTEDGDFTASCTVTVNAAVIAVEGVTLDKESADLTVGGDITLTATVKPDDATDTEVSWTTSNDKVATVDGGKVTAVGAGDAIITVTTKDGGFTATCKVTVTNAVIAVTGVTLDKESAELTIGQTLKLAAVVAPENASNKNITWSSDASAIAKVDQTGTVTAVAEGSATITVETEDGEFFATCDVTVVAGTVAVSGVTVTPTSVSLKVDETASLKATVEPAEATDKTVSWSSSAPEIASVDDNGTITAHAEGSATITVTTTDGKKTATCAVTVVDDAAVVVSAIELNLTELELKVGGGKEIKATVKYSDGTSSTKEDVVWTTDNPDAIDLDEGWVDAIEVGVANVTASFGGKSATCVVTVISNVTVVNVTGVSLNKTEASITKNGSLTLTATVLPTNATNKNVAWSSSDETVATVDDGVLTIVGLGTTTITVTTEDGKKTATCEVTITDVLATNIIIDNALSLTVGETGSIELHILPADAAQTATWKSDKESVATVDANGVVTAVAAGTANITATTTDGTNLTSDPCVVTVSNVKVTAVDLAQESAVVRVGASVTLSATVSPESATNKKVNWSSSKDFATVTDGVVTGVSAGTTTITAESDEDKYIKATCSVEVVDASDLQTEIANGNAALSSAVEGTEIGTYKVGSKSTFSSAIATAQAVFDNATATQAQIDMALSTLKAAAKTFAKSINANETLIFDADMEQENMTYMATYWFSFNDSEPGGSSVVTPLSSEAAPFEMSTPGYDGKGKAAMMEYVLNGHDALGYNAFVGMGMNFKEPAGKAFDMSGSTGISFWMKNESNVYFEIEMVGIEDACDYYVYITDIHKDWTLIELSWSDFEQYSWGKQVAWDVSKLTKCQWKVQEADGEAGQVWIDDVKILGVALDLPEILNRTPLYTAIAEAQEFLDAAVIGDADGNYPQSAATALTAAIAKGQSVVDDATLEHQTQVDAAVIELNAALETFKNSVISLAPVDKSALEAKIQTANNYYQTAQEGNEEGKYLAGSKATLKAAIDEATSVFNSESAKQADVNSATTALSNAIEVFLNSKYIPGVVNKAALKNAIDEANALYASATEGTKKGNYPVGSKSTLYSAIIAAQVVSGSTTVTQDDVDAETATLQAAIATFRALEITVDKSVLEQTITTANAELAKADGNTGDEPGNYPQSAVTAFLGAISDAENIRDNASAKQVSIDAAVSLLKTAIDEFKASVIPGLVDISELQALIDEADDLLENTFNAHLFRLQQVELVNCRSSARTEVAKTKHDPDNVTAIMNRLSDAIEEFKKAKAAHPDEIDAIDDVNVISLSAYPNPCTTTIQISAGKEIASIAIVNLAGATQFVVNVNDTETTIAVSAIKCGIYFANVVYADGTVETIRFVKK